MPDQPTQDPSVPPALQPVLGSLLLQVLRRHGEWLAVKDLSSGRYVLASEALSEFLQRAPGSVLAYTDAELFEPPVATVLRAAEQTAIAQGEPLSSEHRFEQGGRRREFSVLRWATPADAEGARWLCSVWRDLGPERQREAQLRLALEQIEQQQQANELLRRELADQALRDPASGLYRRAHFEDQLRREVDLSTREHREFAIVFIEIDPLAAKVLALGSQGEQLVHEAVGRLLRGGTRAMDASCRYDDQRFAVLLSGVGLATAHARMEGLRRSCATQIVVHEGRELGFTVAMGVASFPHTAQTQDELIAACDSALAEARRRGGNHVTLAAIRFDAA
ncbi:MAG: sensor domain-containing diguanylate cyclase [Leptothrix sp. (in: Bacteria)]|nr:sensor domain-containing diguanylate cyclase [Leptothrix sp. (in: b-proteobacteria)]